MSDPSDTTTPSTTTSTSPDTTSTTPAPAATCTPVDGFGNLVLSVLAAAACGHYGYRRHAGSLLWTAAWGAFAWSQPGTAGCIALLNTMRDPLPAAPASIWW